MTIKFQCDIVDPIFAFTIRSVDGLELTGTNSMNLKQDFGLIKAGEIVVVKFTQTMILNSGQYLLALGCTKYENNTLTVFNRIYDAVAIEVVSTNFGVGVAFVVSDFDINRNK